MRTATAAPHCDAIHAAHIARVTVETLVGRPLSHANTPFVDACLRNLGMLADRLDGLRGSLAAPHGAQAADLRGSCGRWRSRRGRTRSTPAGTTYASPLACMPD